jgi:hypothetical protein
METSRKSKIVLCTYDKVWIGKTDGKEMHYHWLDLEGGEKVKVCVEEKMPQKLSPGTTIEFTKNELTGVIKLIQYQQPGSSAPPKNDYQRSNFGGGAKTQKSGGGNSGGGWKGGGGMKAQPVGAGVSGSYAKDFVVSLLNQGNKKAISNPIELWKQYTNEIHAHLKSLESGDQPDE